MRVTKTIKNYIEKRVSEIYDPKIQMLHTDYDAKLKSLNELLDVLLDKVNQNAKDILAGSGFACTNYRGEEKDIFYHKDIFNDVWRDEIKAKEIAIKKERDEKIEEIIITLELGGTKEELEKMLNALI